MSHDKDVPKPSSVEENLKQNKLGHNEPLKDILVKFRKELDAMRAAIPSGYACADDVLMYRFLKGYKLNADAASKAFNATLLWRRKHKLDDLRPIACKMDQKDWPFSDKMSRIYPNNFYHHKDRIGRPVCIELTGRAKPDLVTKLLKIDEVSSYYYHHMEHKAEILKTESEKSGHVVRICQIMDLSGLSTKHLNMAGIKYFQHVIEFTQHHYPENTGNAYICNPPWMFSLAWKIVKPWLTEQTLAKIIILGDNYKEELRKVVDPANLPKFLGGDCECQGGCVKIVHPDEGMTEVVVKNGDKYVHNVKVDEPSLVSWEFRTRANDIQYSITFTTASKKVETVLPSARVDSAKLLVTGGFEAKEGGTLTFVWDNTYSYWTSKSLLFSVDITKKEVAKAEQAKADVQSSSPPASPQLQAAQPSAQPALLPLEEKKDTPVTTPQHASTPAAQPSTAAEASSSSPQAQAVLLPSSHEKENLPETDVKRSSAPSALSEPAASG
jgi:hypothetical protein